MKLVWQSELQPGDLIKWVTLTLVKRTVFGVVVSMRSVVVNKSLEREVTILDNDGGVLRTFDYGQLWLVAKGINA